jgi:hypothetical protein
MSTRTESTLLDTSSVSPDTNAQGQSFQAPSASTLARLDTVSKRRTKKVVYTHPPGLLERAGQLGIDERRILKDYAGDTTETRTVALEKMESYRRQNNNRPPIIELDRSPGDPKRSWKCMICSEPKVFPTFQKIALHITSTHWRLPSWPCPVNSW